MSKIMKLTFIQLIVFLVMVCMTSCVQYKIRLKRHEDKGEERLKVLQNLKQLQNNIFFPSFRKKESIELKSFKEDQDRRILAYYGVISIGGHKFNMLFDSGSTNVFVMGTNCVDSSCQGHQLYDQSKAKQVVEEFNLIQYICGKSVGVLVTDDVSLGTGGLTIQDQHIHVGHKVEIAAFTNSRWDGIIGLGYYPCQADTVSSQQQELKATGAFKLSVVDNILMQGLLDKDQLFFMYSLDRAGGVITFGELPSRVRPSTITWVQVDKGYVNEEVSWILKLVDVRLQYPLHKQQALQINRKKSNVARNKYKQEIEDQFSAFMRFSKHNRHLSQRNRHTLFRLQKLLSRHQHNQQQQQQQQQQLQYNRRSLCPKGCKLLIDTGTYLNYIPQTMFKQLMGKLDFRDNTCEFKDHPDIIFMFDNDQEIILKPNQYLEMYGIGPSKICTNSFTPDTIENDIITLGQMFLKTFHTIFDFGNKRIGFSSNLNDV